MKKRIALLLALIMIVGSANITMAATSFNDVKDHWAKQEIMALAEKEIINGYKDGSFQPEAKITRAEFVTIINRALNLSKEGKVAFEDVNESDWYYKQIAIASEKAYINGYPDGSFKPEKSITREEAVTVLVNAFDLKVTEEQPQDFKDQAKIQDYAVDAVKIVTSLGYVKGYPNGEFKPQNAISRAEAAKIMYSVINPKSEDIKAADVVYTNGKIYTVNDNFDIVDTMAIKDGKFVYVGDRAGSEAFVGPDTKVIDLAGTSVFPGLIDSHLHYAGVGSKLQQIDAFWAPKEDILADVKKAAEKAEDGEWVLGRGWNQEAWDPAVFPTRLELDEVSPNNPVILTRVCGHATWVNSKAMELAGLDKDGVTPNPTGGEIIRKTAEDKEKGLYEGIEVGEAIGVMTDTASNIIRKKQAPPTEAQLNERYSLANEHILSYGITSVRDAGTGLDGFNRIKKAYEKGDIDLRIYMMASSTEAPTFYKMPASERLGLYGDKLNVRSIKVMADGSLGARSSWMLEEYSDRPGYVGEPRYTDEEIYELTKGAAENGFQINTHAIGDAANRQVLDTYERLIKEYHLKDHRYAIEHAQILDPADLPRFKELGVLPSMQFVHATSDLNMAEDRIGPVRIKTAYAWRSLLDSGVIIPNGTDAQVELVNPFHGLYAGVARMTRDGEPKGGWYPEQKITREEALRSYTIWGAYAQFQEDHIGSIEVGKYADFALIDRDYMSIPESEIKDMEALATFVAGDLVYRSDKLKLDL